MRKSASTVLVVLFALTGCVHRGSYRLEGNAIYPPTSYESNGTLRVDVPLGRPFEGRCAFEKFLAGDATGRFRHSFPGASPTLRLAFSTRVKEALAAQGDLQGGLRDVVTSILQQAKEKGCLAFGPGGPAGRDGATGDDLAELAAFMADQAHARWPMTPWEAVAAWFGPGAVRFIDGEAGEAPRPEGQEIMARVTFLRPGMRVCAQDVVDPSPTSTENIYTIGGTACAIVIDGPKGIAFSGTTPWFDLPFTGSPWAPGGFKQVTSWEEVQLGEGPHRFAILHPTKLPETPPNPVASDGAFLVRYDPSVSIPMQAAFCVKNGLATNECPAHSALQAAGGSYRADILCLAETGNVCIRFGNRSVFVVEIPVDVNGSRLYLPAGSTLSGLVGPAPAFGAGDGRGPLDRVRLYRWFDSKRYRVQLGEGALDLPLQSGDEIRW